MNNHRLKISSSNISIDEYVTPDFARKVIALLYSDSSVIITPSQETGNQKNTPQKRQDVIVTIKDKSPEKSGFTIFCEKHNVVRSCEIVLAAGVFLNLQGHDSFSKKDYQTLFLDYKGSNPTNAPRNIEWAQGNNWITQVHENNYKVTSVGKRVLKENFPDSVRGSTRGNSKKKATKS